MKKKSDKLFMLIIFLKAMLIMSCKHSADESNIHLEHDTKPVYYCPMHPEIESDKPGHCPKCNMTLELKEELGDVLISPNKQVLSRQKTVKLKATNDKSFVKAEGYIDIDKSHNQNFSARYGGRIEKLYVKYAGQYVKKNEIIMELYSPEVRTFQEEHLLLLKSPAEKSLIEQSREKLRLLGITDVQISELEKAGTIISIIAVYSPYEGYVFFGNETPDETASTVESNSSMNEMNMSQNPEFEKSFTESLSQIREGMYVSKGQTLFSINDLQNVWAVIFLSNELVFNLKNRKSINIVSEILPDKPLIGNNLLIEPFYEEKKQNFARMRVELKNDDKKLKINSLVHANIPTESKITFKIPASAVFHTGLSSMVWVKDSVTKNGTGIFNLRKVVTSTKGYGFISIIDGVTEGEEVAIEAGLMIDSETFLSEN
jgi:Cu(I)/Ag(I) efflux system membrane fusion protein